MYIADQFTYRIRKITVSTGVLSTIAGDGTGSYSGDEGAATSTALYQPTGVALDTSGRLLYLTALNIFFIVYFLRQRVRR